MAWLGEELSETRQGEATRFSPRTVKDEIEEALFERRKDLFTCSCPRRRTCSRPMMCRFGSDRGRNGRTPSLPASIPRLFQ
jgi:hypothetical protein